MRRHATPSSDLLVNPTDPHAQATRARAGVEVPVVRITVAPAAGLGDLRGRRVGSQADAAAVLAPFLGPRQASRRLAAALVDARQRLRAVALFDGADDSACCLRPSDLAEALIVAGANGAWLAHRHRARGLHAVRQDLASTERASRLIAPLGLCVRDHLIVGAGRYVGLVEAQAKQALWWSLRQRREVVLRDPRVLLRSRAGTPPAPAPVSRRVSFTLVGLRARRVDRAGPRAPRRPHVDSHDDAAPLVAPYLDTRPWVAALVDRDSRLIAVALPDSGRGRPCSVVAADVYRAAVTLGAARVFLAHRHDGPEAALGDADLEAAHEAYVTGYALGRELCDVLVFQGEQHVSLRTLGSLPDWRAASDNHDPSYPRRRLLWHQLQANRRPAPRYTRCSAAARAALWRCLHCRRRQNARDSCRYCGKPRRGAPARPAA